jgi:hypothetical protein
MTYLTTWFGVEETERELIFDLDLCVKKYRNNGKFGIIGGIITIWLAGIGLIAIIIGIIWMILSPEQIFNMSHSWVLKESQKSGKPIVYRNLTPYLQSRYQSGTPVQGFPSQVSSPQQPINPPIVPASPQPADDTMFCRFCGATIKKTAKFCNKCGSPI